MINNRIIYLLRNKKVEIYISLNQRNTIEIDFIKLKTKFYNFGSVVCAVISRDYIQNFLILYLYSANPFLPLQIVPEKPFYRKILPYLFVLLYLPF